jgi:hypothetical protein
VARSPQCHIQVCQLYAQRFAEIGKTKSGATCSRVQNVEQQYTCIKRGSLIGPEVETLAYSVRDSSSSSAAVYFLAQKATDLPTNVEALVPTWTMWQLILIFPLQQVGVNRAEFRKAKCQGLCATTRTLPQSM